MKRSVPAAVFALGLLSTSAHADTGAPPADVGAVVTAPKVTAPEPEKPSTDFLTVAINLGAQLATGNSRLFAGSAGGKLDMRVKNEGFGAAIIGNYSTADTGTGFKDTVRNLQGRLRYERYFTRDFSAFVQLTGTHDPFQALTFRFNVDPGVKLLFVNRPHTKFWGELGYDFEYDLNYTDAAGFEQAGPGGNVLDAANLPYVVMKDNTMHSARAYLGFQHAFNKEVVFTTGLELLQGVGGSGDGLPGIPAGFTDAEVDRVRLNLTRTRVNFDAALAANMGAGFSVAAAFSAKWNSAPLPGKENLDTMTTLSLIYTLSRDAKKAPAAPPAAPPPPTPPPPPAAVVQAPPQVQLDGFVLDHVTFRSPSEIDADASKDQLQRIAAAMKNQPNVTLRIAGPADDDEKGSLARADAVQAALVGVGVAAGRLRTEAGKNTYVELHVAAK